MYKLDDFCGKCQKELKTEAYFFGHKIKGQGQNMPSFLYLCEECFKKHTNGKFFAYD